MSAPLTLALILAVAIPAFLVMAYRWDERAAERWAEEHGVRLTPGTAPMVARYLRRARVARTWGGVAGAVVPSLLEFLWSGRVQVLGFGTDGESAPLGFGTIFVGYLLGALYAEVSLPRPRAPGRRAAGLAPRELPGYLPRRVVLAQRALAGAAAVGLLALGLVPFGDSVADPGLVSMSLGAAFVLAFGAILEATERWLVRRPQPYTSAAAVAADDAIRAHSIRAVSGAGLALLLLACGGVSLGLQASDVRVLQWAMVGPAATCLVLSIVACRQVGEGVWRVERLPRSTGAASA